MKKLPFLVSAPLVHFPYFSLFHFFTFSLFHLWISKEGRHHDAPLLLILTRMNIMNNTMKEKILKIRKGPPQAIGSLRGGGPLRLFHLLLRHRFDTCYAEHHGGVFRTEFEADFGRGSEAHADACDLRSRHFRFGIDTDAAQRGMEGTEVAEADGLAIAEVLEDLLLEGGQDAFDVVTGDGALVGDVLTELVEGDGGARCQTWIILDGGADRTFDGNYGKV